MKMYVIPRIGKAIGAAATSATFTIVGTPATYSVFKGLNQKTLVEIPTWTNDVTLAWKIADPNGTLLFEKDNLTKTQTAEITDPFPVFEGCVVTMTLSGVPGGTGGTIYTTIYYGG